MAILERDCSECGNPTDFGHYLFYINTPNEAGVMERKHIGAGKLEHVPESVDRAQFFKCPSCGNEEKTEYVPRAEGEPGMKMSCIPGVVCPS